MIRVHSILCTTPVELDAYPLDPNISMLHGVGAGAVVMKVGHWPVVMTPAEARMLARHLTLTAERAEEVPGDLEDV
ncbi:hypothetical protein GUY44_18980 [Pimelobacter simplex]|uniref:Uncharacterized protein n=1 Tax=Nocardioides simplex TaxID=2045 RepID=A0A0A1DN94_NOCSI|nr:hypothetical protein [Pimelobacter simplex]AIY17988.1 hypothetical protein KR76_16675 [Pimelobacter simplex]MCG8152576.1 hypothetical protein [Pimelobacter simplex]GEB17045.1 hypothetical protein NSI01_53600 [Pimelobacter simplex]SFM76726.1 hypothetical protein SAMN05421671_3420 [Pimelobacter simplex]